LTNDLESLTVENALLRLQESGALDSDLKIIDGELARVSDSE